MELKCLTKLQLKSEFNHIDIIELKLIKGNIVLFYLEGTQHF
jgi:hypothetical protein